MLWGGAAGVVDGDSADNAQRGASSGIQVGEVLIALSQSGLIESCAYRTECAARGHRRATLDSEGSAWLGRIQSIKAESDRGRIV